MLTLIFLSLIFKCRIIFIFLAIRHRFSTVLERGGLPLSYCVGYSSFFVCLFVFFFVLSGFLLLNIFIFKVYHWYLPFFSASWLEPWYGYCWSLLSSVHSVGLVTYGINKTHYIGFTQVFSLVLNFWLKQVGVAWHARHFRRDQHAGLCNHHVCRFSKFLFCLVSMFLLHTSGYFKIFWKFLKFYKIMQVLILLIVLAMRQRVELVAALFREAGKSVHAMPMLLIQPLWTLIALCALCAGWVYAALWIESAGYPTRAEAGPVFFQKDTYLQVGYWRKWKWRNQSAFFHFIKLFYSGYSMVQYLGCSLAFTTLLGIPESYYCWSCCWMVFYKVVGIWNKVNGALLLNWEHKNCPLLNRDKSRLTCPVAKSIGYAIRYHLGSLAFGSLLIALMKLIRMLFNYFERKLRNSTTTCFGLVTCLTCFCKCCLYCFEQFLQGLCSNAYIEIGTIYVIYLF